MRKPDLKNVKWRFLSERDIYVTKVPMIPLKRERERERERERDFAKPFVNIFSIQEKEDDTQDGIDQDQPLLLEQLTSLKMESTPSQDNRDIILDVTLFSENRAEVSNVYFIKVTVP